VVAFDLDPGPPADIVDCSRVALRLREVLEQLNLQNFAKTSGSKGMQLYVPLNTKISYEKTRPFAQAIAQIVANQDPENILAKMGKRTDRSGKVFIDWYQNNERKTTISVYSLRARDRPTCSTPITWEEVEQAAESGRGNHLVFETGDVLKRLDEHGDLFAPVLELEQELPQI
jgi:bifunctional non-homologous end joining protein LigD